MTVPKSQPSARADLRRGAVFAMLTACVFVLLLVAGRPHWAAPWLVASIFTFGLSRLGRKPAP